MSEKDIKIYRGNIIYTPSLGTFKTIPKGYIIVQGETVLDVVETLPEKYLDFPVQDYGDNLIIPGFVDLHFHAPQFSNRGLGMDKELLPWLESYTFPEEAKFKDVSYGENVYKKVVEDVWKNGTTRAVFFASIHKEATEKLMELLNRAGLGAYVGKVNMDRNSPDYLIEDTKQSLLDTEKWIEEYKDKYALVKPIITPRFVPSCTPELMRGLGNIANKYKVPVQSHLSENMAEVKWVKELHPEAANYASVYAQYDLFGQQPTIMAHCVYNDKAEMELMAKNNVYVAHCPYSNNNLSSGIAPIREFLNYKIPVGLATDVSGGHTTSIADVMATAVHVSKLKWLQTDKRDEALTMAEVFYLGTKGGGAFFGKVGSFEDGYEFDALIVDDSSLKDPNERSLVERLERFIYLGDDRNISERYVAGKKINKPDFGI